jgi:hypothetical protein
MFRKNRQNEINPAAFRKLSGKFCCVIFLLPAPNAASI